jgi:O-antigen/teichoic acid export membrane protein
MIKPMQAIGTWCQRLWLRWGPRSASSRNVLQLAGGTAGSQVIAVAAAPFLTRLYGPEIFGVLASFTAVLALLNVISSLRFELAIAVPEDDDDAVGLVWLCLALVMVSTVVTIFCVLVARDPLLMLLKAPALGPLLWLLPIGVFLCGIYQPLNYWAIRRKQFALLAQTRFRQIFFGVVVTLLAAPLGAMGLLFGQVIGQSVGFLAILRNSPELIRWPPPSLATMASVLHRYRHFGIYGSPAGLINTIGNQVPNIIFASVYGAAQLGQLALAQRLLFLPAALIGGSVAQVFLGQAAEHYRDGSLPNLMRQISRRLWLYGLIIAAAATLVLTPLMPLIFGREWQPTQWIIPVLIPLFLGQLVHSPVSMAFISSQSNKDELIAQICLLASRLVALLIPIGLGFDFAHALVVYSSITFLGYSLYGKILTRALSFAA